MGSNLRERKALLADRLRAGLRHRPDLDARDFLSGAVVHRRAVRGQLRDRRQRAGQAARQQIPRTSRRSPPSTRPSTCGPRRRPAPPDGRPEGQARPAAQGAEGGPGRAQPPRARDEAGPRDPERRLREAQRNKTNLAKRLAKTAPPSAARVEDLDLVAQQYRRGNIPSKYNGTLSWPMAGNVTQDFGCTGVVYEPPLGSCPHLHNGIDIVAPCGTPIQASGAGTGRLHRLELRRRLGPGLDRDRRPQRASQTWYAHMQPHYPGGSTPAVGDSRARSSATRATPATRRAATSTGWSSSTATS